MEFTHGIISPEQWQLMKSYSNLKYSDTKFEGKKKKPVYKVLKGDQRKL